MPNSPHSRSLADEDRWMTLKEIGEEFKANSETVRLWVTRGELPAVRAGRKWLVRRSEVLRLIGSRATSADAAEQLRDRPAISAGLRRAVGRRARDLRGA